MKVITNGFLCMLLCIGCISVWGQRPKSDFVIMGSIEGADDINIYLAPVDENFNIIYPGDSTPVKRGQFTFRGKTAHSRLYYLYSKDIAFQQPAFILVAPGVMKVVMNVHKPDAFRITGNAATMAYFLFSREYDGALLGYNKSFEPARLPSYKRDTLHGKTRWVIKETANCYLLKTDTIRPPAVAPDGMTGLKTEYGTVKIDLRDTAASGDIIIRLYGDSSGAHLKRTVFKHLEKNRNTETGAIIAYLYFVNPHYTDETAHAYNMLSAGARNTPFGKSLKQYIDINTLRKKIDFSFTDINGHKMSLADIHSKYIFIHFWAAWCPNCFPQNKELAALYAKYSRDKFELINISFDSSRSEWEKGIKADALPGIHSSELKVFDNRLARMFNIRLLPSGFLLDSNRNIILMNPDMVNYINAKMGGK